MDPTFIEEELNPGLKGSLFSNFSNYSDAVLELTDNAVSNRIEGKKIKVEVLTSKDKLTIINRGGYGMDIEDLRFFASWGKLKDRTTYDIGKYAQGGKAAMGYLGRTIVIIASPHGDKRQYRIEDTNLRDITKLKKYPVQVIEGEYLDGCVEIEVGHLSRNIKEIDLKKKMINIYRPLIENNSLDLVLNGLYLKPESFPLDEDFNIEKFNFNIDNNKVRGWIGRLGPRTGVKGGLRCYSKGRLVCDRVFFGHPDASYKGTLNFLFGEVYLDFIPVIMNKTDFDRDSKEWEETSKMMFNILKPHVDELLGREIEEPSDEEIARVKQARNLVAYLQKLKQKFEKGTEIEGDDYGQKSRTKNLALKETSKPEKIRGPYKPATPPPPGAIGKRHRTREFMDWDIRPMAESLRSIVEKKENGEELLVINNVFPGHKVANGNTLYLIETAAIQLAKPSDGEIITYEEYISRFDELYSFFCSNLDVAKEDLKRKGKLNEDNISE